MSFKTEHQPFLKYSDDPTITEIDSQNHHAQRHNKVLSHFLVFITTSLLWVLVTFTILPGPAALISIGKVGEVNVANSHNITTNAKLLTCGNSTQEARSLDCKYDILLNNWVPAPCVDEEWVEEYRDDGSWGAFGDEALTQPLTLDEMMGREFYYTSLRDHVNHCAIMWKKQFFALYEERRAIDTVIASPGHTDHCAQFLMEAMDKERTQSTKTVMGFAGCWVRE